MFLIPFYVAYKREDEYIPGRGPFERLRDSKLREALRHELPGILAWAVEGCRLWQKRGGLGTCDAVRRATHHYREDQDQLAGFLADMCYLEEGASVPFSELYSAYEQWTEEAREKPVAKRTFGQKLANKGIRPGRVKSGGRSVRVREGIRLRLEGEEPQRPAEVPPISDRPDRCQEPPELQEPPMPPAPPLDGYPPSAADPWKHHPWYQ